MGGELELAVEDPLEELPLAARAPELELGVAGGAQAQQHERRADPRRDRGDDVLAAPVQTVGDAQQRGHPPDAIARAVVELTDEVVARLGLAAAVPANERGEQQDLLGVEAAQLTVRDEVRGVPVVVVVGDVLADVVQQRGVLEELTVAVVESVELAGLVEELEAQARDLAGV